MIATYMKHGITDSTILLYMYCSNFKSLGSFSLLSYSCDNYSCRHPTYS